MCLHMLYFAYFVMLFFACDQVATHLFHNEFRPISCGNRDIGRIVTTQISCIIHAANMLEDFKNACS